MQEYRGQTKEVTFSGSINRLRLNVIAITRLAENRYSVTLFNDVSFEQARNGILSKHMPPFWLAVLSAEPLVGNINLLQISRSYLREIGQSFDDLVETLNLLQNDNLRVHNSNKKLLTIQLIVQGSITEQVILAVRQQPPRELTSKEIDYICDQIPLLPYSDTKIAVVQREEIVAHLRKQSVKGKVTPLAFKKLANTIYNSYLRSLMQPQEQIGVATVDSVTAPAMQNALNARHKFGTSAGMSATIELFEQILLNQSIKTKEMIIFFENRHLSEDDIIASKYLFEQVMFDDLIVEFQLGAIESLRQWWWDPYMLIKNIQIPEDSQICLEIKLDAEVMFDHQIALTDVVNVILNYTKAIKIIASPILLEDGAEINDFDLIDVKRPVAYLHIFCIKDLARSELKTKQIVASDDMIEMAFLRQSALPELRALLISGIPGVLEIEPRHYELMPEDKDASNSYILSSTLIDADNNIWELFCNKYLLRKSCLTLDDVIYLLNTIRQQTDRILNIQIPIETVINVANIVEQRLSRDRIFVTFVARPGETLFSFVENTIKTEAKAWKSEQTRQRDLRKHQHYSLPITPLLTANRIYFVRAIGSNLRRVCLLDIVDPNSTFCNVPNEMMEVFGIEVAMVVIIKILLDVLENTKVYIDLMYVKLVTEFKCNQGIILSLDHYGANKQPNETLARATASRAVPVITKTAAMAKGEENGSVSSAILTAKLANFGPGAVVVQPKNVISPILRIRVPTNRPMREEMEVDPAAIIDGDIGDTPKVKQIEITPLLVKPAVLVETPAAVIPPTLLEADYQVTSKYTASAAEKVRIPVATAKDPFLVTSSIADVILPDFNFIGLTYPDWLDNLFNSLGINVPIAPSVQTKPLAPSLVPTTPLIPTTPLVPTTPLIPTTPLVPTATATPLVPTATATPLVPTATATPAAPTPAKPATGKLRGLLSVLRPPNPKP